MSLSNLEKIFKNALENNIIEIPEKRAYTLFYKIRKKYEKRIKNQ